MQPALRSCLERTFWFRILSSTNRMWIFLRRNERVSDAVGKRAGDCGDDGLSRKDSLMSRGESPCSGELAREALM